MPLAPHMLPVKNPDLLVPPRPWQVRVAVGLLQLSVVVPYFVIPPVDPDMIDKVGSVLYLLLISLLNAAVFRGKNWARWLTLLLFVLGVVLVVTATLLRGADSTPPSALEWSMTLGGILFEAAAVYFIFTRPGSGWFKRLR